MGSSSKSGSNTTRHYYASIPALVGWGPIDGIAGILLNGERVWWGTLHRSQSTNPVNLTTKYGTIRFYWGTEDQPADPLCPGRRYKGIAYLMFVDFDHGQATNAYNTEVILLGGAPQQSIVTGAAAQASYANGIAVNPIALAAEILTSPIWRGLPAARIDAPSFQALADAVPAATAISPLYNDAADLASILAAATGMVDGWLRRTAAGLIQAGRWNDAAATSVTMLTHDDFVEMPSFQRPRADDDVPNSYAVEFVDRTALHKEAKIVVNDDAALAVPGVVLNRKTLSTKHLITYEKAQLAGREALRRAAKLGTWSGTVRIGKARTPAGVRIQPGDYLRVPLAQPHEPVQTTQLIRVKKVVWPRDAIAGVKIEADLAPVLQPSLALAPEAEPVAEIPASVPPINRARVFALPSASPDVQPPIYIVAARPADTALGFSIHFDTDLDGDFPAIERSTGYALPVTLGAAISAGAASLTLVLRPAGAYGENFERDASLLRDWTGGATQGRNDELLVVLVNTDDTVEICSISGTPTLTAADTFAVPVLRGRLGTASASHASATEAWVVHSTSLAAIEHADIMAAATSGATLYFQPGAYTLRTTYAPAEAYTEATRRTEAEEPLAEYAAQPDAATWVPTLTLVIPAGYLPPGDESNLQPGTYDQLNGVQLLGLPGGAIPVQTRGGMWSLVGHVACDGVTDSPPKRWRKKAYSGAATNRTWNVYPTYPEHPDYYACGESTLHCTTVYELRGQCMYDRDTGIATNTLKNVLTQTGPNCGSPEGEYHSANACEDLLPGVNPGPGTLHTTHTAQWYTLSGVCTYSYPVLTGSIVTGEIRVDISVEDTDEDAVRRMLLTSPAWGTAHTTAIWTIRTDGITGLYREIRHRTEHTEGDPAETLPTLTGLNPRQRYRLTVWLASRPVDSAGTPTGTGEWAADGTRKYLFETDADGKGGIDWQTIEPKQGYETYIAANLVEVY